MNIHTLLKKKMRNYDQNMQKLWNKINKSPHLRFSGFEEEAETQANGIDSLVSETIAVNFPNFGNEMGIQVQETPRTSSRQDLKRTSPQHTILKMLEIQNKGK